MSSRLRAAIVILTALFVSKPAIGQSFTKEGEVVPQYHDDAPVVTSCDSLRHDGVAYGSNGDYLTGFNLLKQFIEECAAGIHHPDYNWISLFGQISGSASGVASSQPSAPLAYRDWLKSVLYINPDTDYYCADVLQMLGTFVDSVGRSTVTGVAERLAIVQYVLESGKCPQFSHDYELIYTAQQRYRHEVWGRLHEGQWLRHNAESV